jgi:hypothetical protein
MLVQHARALPNRSAARPILHWRKGNAFRQVYACDETSSRAGWLALAKAA